MISCRRRGVSASALTLNRELISPLHSSTVHWLVRETQFSRRPCFPRTIHSPLSSLVPTSKSQLCHDNIETKIALSIRKGFCIKNATPGRKSGAGSKNPTHSLQNTARDSEPFMVRTRADQQLADGRPIGKYTDGRAQTDQQIQGQTRVLGMPSPMIWRAPLAGFCLRLS